ncbi:MULTISPECIES: hypothetical protein [unclassified Campylobacter]|uniref:hypothetical protein n=1 Tax=unclassified Campylobacter TaxID=2593542 RepID=UPI0022E9B469|nr:MULTISPECIES: hypothetical protein [unclassified Campylobacter]MDA3063027.1 hypothetical protein [Campylobacter sp. JMF_14 EL1]MDA3072676.1 hypothetical protein [Campylobacter sp. JMF_10 EL2]
MKIKILSVFTICIFAFFTGCAKAPVNSGIVRTSEPIFITKMPEKKFISVSFTNTSTSDLNLTSAVSEYLVKDGFVVVKNEKDATIKVGGNINYFRLLSVGGDYYARPRFSFGFGFGGGRGHRHSHWGVGMGFPMFYDPWYDDVPERLYDAQVGLLISVKNGKAWQDYTTNLTYQNSSLNLSKSRAIDAFNYKIYEHIKQILSR